MHVEALLPHDSRSRIEYWNGDDVSPRFFLGRTDKGNLWRFRTDLPDEICEALEALCKAEPTNISEPPRYKDDYMRILSAHTPIERVWNGPDYWFADEIASTDGPIAITDENAYLLQNGLEAWVPDVSGQQPFMAMIEEGRAVSVCASVCISDTIHSMIKFFSVASGRDFACP